MRSSTPRPEPPQLSPWTEDLVEVEFVARDRYFGYEVRLRATIPRSALWRIQTVTQRN